MKLRFLGALLCALSIGAPAMAQSAYGKVVSASVTRPANTTQYTANTAISTSTSTGTYLTFTNVCQGPGRTVLIPQASIVDYANQTTKLSGVLVLFTSPPQTVLADNATFNVASSDAANKAATIPFTVSTVLNQNSGATGIAEASITGNTYVAQCANNDTNLYGMLEATNAYTPVSGEVIAASLKVVGVN